MVKLVDMPDLGSGAARRVGSSPIIRTKKASENFQKLFFWLFVFTLFLFILNIVRGFNLERHRLSIMNAPQWLKPLAVFDYFCYLDERGSSDRELAKQISTRSSTKIRFTLRSYLRRFLSRNLGIEMTKLTILTAKMD